MNALTVRSQTFDGICMNSISVISTSAEDAPHYTASSVDALSDRTHFVTSGGKIRLTFLKGHQYVQLNFQAHAMVLLGIHT